MINLNLFRTATFWFNLTAVLVELANEIVAKHLFGDKIPLEILTAIIVIGNVLLRTKTLNDQNLDKEHIDMLNRVVERQAKKIYRDYMKECEAERKKNA